MNIFKLICIALVCFSVCIHASIQERAAISPGTPFIWLCPDNVKGIALQECAVNPIEEFTVIEWKLLGYYLSQSNIIEQPKISKSPLPLIVPSIVRSSINVLNEEKTKAIKLQKQEDCVPIFSLSAFEQYKKKK